MNRALAPLRIVGDPSEQHRRDRERIAALEAELDEANETIRLLRAGEAVEWQPPVEFCLTGLEGAVLRALLGHEGCLTKERIMDLIYSDRIHEDEVPMIKIVDVFICKMRRKLKPYELAIDTFWGRGYGLDALSRTRLKTWHVPT